jgi:hypothetical protein
VHAHDRVWRCVRVLACVRGGSPPRLALPYTHTRRVRRTLSTSSYLSDRCHTCFDAVYSVHSLQCECACMCVHLDAATHTKPPTMQLRTLLSARSPMELALVCIPHECLGARLGCSYHMSVWAHTLGVLRKCSTPSESPCMACHRVVAYNTECHNVAAFC